MQKQRSFLQPSAEVMELPTPIWWVHVPRTGASFGYYTLLKMASLCHGLETEDSGPIMIESVRERCPGISVDDRCTADIDFSLCTCTSVGGSMYTRAKGKMIGFFRQPEIRLLSDYLHYNDGTEITAWAQERLGCHVKKLTWDGHGVMDGGWHCKGEPPTWDEVNTA